MLNIIQYIHSYYNLRIKGPLLTLPFMLTDQKTTYGDFWHDLVLVVSL